MKESKKVLKEYQPDLFDVEENDFEDEDDVLAREQGFESDLEKYEYPDLDEDEIDELTLESALLEALNPKDEEEEDTDENLWKIEKKKTLKEDANLATLSMNFMRYEDDEVTATIKDLFDTDSTPYGDFELKRIMANGDSFFTIEVALLVDDDEEDFSKPIEFKKSFIAQKLHALRTQLFADMSTEGLPIINASITSVTPNKVNNQISFGINLLFSNTNNRDWATGKKKIIK